MTLTKSTPNTRIHYAGKTDPGRVRSINQDSFFVGDISDKGVMAIVADGMGGHNSGEVASQKAVEVLQRSMGDLKGAIPTAIAKAVQVTNLEVFNYAQENPEHKGMGTTLTTVFIDDQIGFIGHVGDSRAYLIREGSIKQLTQDHSWVADQVRQGILTEAEAQAHRWRNVITNALGARAKFKLDIMHFEVQSGDRLFLCSDGINIMISDQKLLEIIESHSPEEAVDYIINLANERGSPDNVTAVILDLEQIKSQNKRYALPPHYQDSPESIYISATLSGIRKVEEDFPQQDFWSNIQRQTWYKYRFWILGSLYFVLLILIFTLQN